MQSKLNKLLQLFLVLVTLIKLFELDLHNAENNVVMLPQDAGNVKVDAWNCYWAETQVFRNLRNSKLCWPDGPVVDLAA